MAELMQARKRLQSEMALETPRLDQGIAVAEAKLNEAWKDLTDHRQSHEASQQAGA